MADETSLDQQIADMKKQLEFLQQQLIVSTAQRALDTEKQTQEAQLAKTIAEALKNQVAAQYDLELTQAKLPLAEYAGVKAALGNTQLPAGKEGTVQIVAGTAGTALLRSKEPMLVLLRSIAAELSVQLKKLPQINGKSPSTVIVTEAQLDQAYQAKFTLTRIDEQIKSIKTVIEKNKPKRAFGAMGALPAFAAAAYSLGFVMDTVNSFSKLFRVDRKTEIFSADAEAIQMLGYLLQGMNDDFIMTPALVQEEIVTQADVLFSKLKELFDEIQLGNDHIAELKRIEEEEAKNKIAKKDSILPNPENISALKVQIESAKSLVEALDPNKKPDMFWAQAKGQLILKSLENRYRLLLEAKAQALQINESRFLASDRKSISGEVQVAYRILNVKGEIIGSGVILKASKARVTSFLEDFSFSGMPVSGQQ